jgi:NAD+ kinase
MGQMERRVGLIVHKERIEATEIARELISFLEARGITACLDEDAAQRIGRMDTACRGDEWSRCEFVITLGGDGTILMAAGIASPFGIPILGVHLGRFGFIAETHPAGLMQHLERILNGEMRLQERMMVRAEVWRAGKCIQSRSGLNDALVKSRASQLLQIRTRLAGADFAVYPADGIIIATPTGSTAYSLSAGGPLVAPTVKAMVVTPICPHTLSARPMLVPSDEVVEIDIETDSADVVCSVDGIDLTPIESGDRIVIRKAECVTRLIVLDHATFYRKVRDRYLYGERLND